MNTRISVAATIVALGLAASHASACSQSAERTASGSYALLTASSGARAEAFSRFASGINASQAGNGGFGAISASAKGRSIVGYWKFAFTAPDGTTGVDFGFQQWHDDGTELTNSGGQLPPTGNFCTGVWQQTGGTYHLNHWAIGWNLPATDPSDLFGYINIRETVSVDPTGNNMSGTFSLDLYDLDATTFLAHLVDGTVSATRITP